MKKVRVDRPRALPSALEELGLDPPLPTLVLSGGAARVEVSEFARLRPGRVPCPQPAHSWPEGTPLLSLV
jgi:hypothetical protein